jgi:hypothetical protein
VNPRVCLHDFEKRKFSTLPGLELRPLSRPARSQSLYRLRYPAPIANRRFQNVAQLKYLENESKKNSMGTRISTQEITEAQGFLSVSCIMKA